MAQHNQPTNTYTQGHSNFTIATHLARTAEADAGFLLPHIKKTDHILDVGCGPGTITTGLAKYASEGTTIGVDNSAAVVQKAQTLVAESKTPTEGPGSVIFQEGNILEGLPYSNDTFDIIFCSQLFGHLPPPDLPLQALAEMRRVLKPGGILATRDQVASHFYPRSLDLDRLWTGNAQLAAHNGKIELDPTGTRMPTLLRAAGFDAGAGKVRVGAGTRVFAGREEREWLAWRAEGQLKRGDPFYQSWVDAGISEEEIQETLVAVRKWVETEDAWFAALQGEMLAWK